MKVNYTYKVLKALFEFNEFCENIAGYIVDHAFGSCVISFAVVIIAYIAVIIKNIN